MYFTLIAKLWQSNSNQNSCDLAMIVTPISRGWIVALIETKRTYLKVWTLKEFMIIEILVKLDYFLNAENCNFKFLKILIWKAKNIKVQLVLYKIS